MSNDELMRAIEDAAVRAAAGQEQYVTRHKIEQIAYHVASVYHTQLVIAGLSLTPDRLDLLHAQMNEMVRIILLREVLGDSK
jgi:hypothetical protein